jgi:hypothetical protein
LKNTANNPEVFMHSERDISPTLFKRLDVWTQDHPSMITLAMANLSLLGVAGAVSAERSDSPALAVGLASFAGSTLVGTIAAFKNGR